MRTNANRTTFILLLAAAAGPAAAQMSIHNNHVPGATFAHNEQGRTPSASTTILSIPPLNTLLKTGQASPALGTPLHFQVLAPDLSLISHTPLALQTWPASTTLEAHPLPGSLATPLAAPPAIPAPSTAPLFLLAAAAGFRRRRR